VVPISSEYDKVFSTIEESRMTITSSWSSTLDFTIAVISMSSLIHTVVEGSSLESAISTFFSR
jgi:hypothetical protein